MKKFNSLKKYEILGDGRLKIKARIFKEGVFLATPDEVNIKSDQKLLNVYYPMRNFFTDVIKEKIKTAPIVINHETVTAEKNAGICGNVVGDPYLSKDGYVECDIVVNKKEVIDDILNKKLHDVSPKFAVKTTMEAGVFEDQQYDAFIDVLDIEHISLLSSDIAGRQGKEVSLLNSGEKIMEDLQKQIDELTKKYNDLHEKYEDTLKTSQVLTEENKKLKHLSSEEELAKRIKVIEDTRVKAKDILKFQGLKIADFEKMSATDLKRETLKAFDNSFDASSYDDKALDIAFDFCHKSVIKAKATNEASKASQPGSGVSVVSNAAHVTYSPDNRAMSFAERNKLFREIMSKRSSKEQE